MTSSMYLLHCNGVAVSDARIKSKFWGKSMEVFPIGTVNVTLPKYVEPQSSI